MALPLFNFRFNKSPRPVQQVPCRMSVTVQIDGLRLSYNPINGVAPLLGVNQPELSLPIGGVLLSGNSSATVEFDLEQTPEFPNGMDEVRTLIAFSRPYYGFSSVGGNLVADDAAGASQIPTSAYLTNTATLQTEILGGNAAVAAETILFASGGTDVIATERIVVPFHANKGAMKMRFISVLQQRVTGTPPAACAVGKYTLIFANYDMPATGPSIGLITP